MILFLRACIHLLSIMNWNINLKVQNKDSTVSSTKINYYFIDFLGVKFTHVCFFVQK